MKNLSRILTMMLCFAPLCASVAGPVATTAGSNLTAFNPSTANNNQWATMSNGRYDTNTTAKVDFGNCNAVVLRCAQPKCANGGCSDYSIASSIVTGCVQSNDTCKQYGNDLVQYMSAQLVASSTAKINEQNAAAQQAAAAAAAQQSQQQMQEMQYQMQQMQAQMAQQQAESAAQLQNALAQQAAQNAAAIESVKSAATDAAKENEAGISAYQQDAINRGVSTDILEREKITGQVMTELENAEVQMKTLKTVMNTAFEYAGCDARGNNCTGPKRVKKWRELAIEFLDPYDEVINKTYDALELAQIVGVDLTDIYMMLNNSCNRWGQYMCPGTGNDNAKVYYGYANQPDDKKETPRVCNTCKEEGNKTTCHTPTKEEWQNCQPCTLLKVLSNGEEVYDGWVYAEENAKSNQTIVACASGALDSSALFARRTKNKNGAGLVDIDKLDTWLHQKEPSKKYKSGPDLIDYCNAGYEDYREFLEKSALSRIAPAKGAALCIEKISYEKAKTEDRSECGYISPIYAICDTHPYNAGKTSAGDTRTGDEENKKACNAVELARLEEASNVVFAYKEDEKTCKAILCKSGYKPMTSGNYGCETTADEAWKEGGVSYNAALTKYNEYMREQFGEMKEIVALKTTVISQQMYKQYEYLSATLRRLKTQLEKATLTAKLQAAGAKDDDSSSSSGLLGGGSKSSQYRNCSGKDDSATLDCLRENYSTIYSQTKEGKKCNNKDARNQITKDIRIMNALLDKNVAKDKDDNDLCASVDSNNCEACLDYYNAGMNNLKRQMQKDEADRNRRYP